MKTYILKRTVYNNETFPIGTIVKHTTGTMVCFEVVEGEMKGMKGGIADGLEGWVVDDTPENRTAIKELLNEETYLRNRLKTNSEKMQNIPSAELSEEEKVGL